jgi:hypothetical protein
VFSKIGKIRCKRHFLTSFRFSNDTWYPNADPPPTITHLDMRESKIEELPSSIGKLKNLEDLDLSLTSNLSELPLEIGDLSSLKKLDLSGSKLTSLPSSIGRLQNLEHLRLRQTKHMSNLPEEIGDLSSLNSLHLTGSYITSLPSSIGRLQNLKNLDLDRTFFRIYRKRSGTCLACTHWVYLVQKSYHFLLLSGDCRTSSNFISLIQFFRIYRKRSGTCPV